VTILLAIVQNCAEIRALRGHLRGGGTKAKGRTRGSGLFYFVRQGGISR
jgi:hypothetical protein